MSISRKRFRPLDPAEEREIKSDQRLGLEVLEDEQSYYFSWPDASLTALLANADAYVQKHVYRKNVINGYGNTSKSHCVSGASLSSSDRIGPTSLNISSRQVSTSPSSTVLLASVPTVYDLRNICVLSSTTDDKCDLDLGEFLQDMMPILKRVMGTEKCGNTAAIMMTTENSNKFLNSTCPSQPKKTKEDYRATHYSPPKSVTYEDSIFTLHAQQLSDAKAAGLISIPASDMVSSKEKQKYTHPEHVVVILANGSNSEMEVRKTRQETGLFSRSSDSEPCLQRWRVENEIVGLEWRAFGQSKRTAAALRRLLSLEAAVPFEPLTNSINEVPAEVSVENNKLQKRGSSSEYELDVWREKVYCLWLHWRLCSGPNGSVLTSSSQFQDHQSTLSKSALLNTNSSSQETNSITTCFHARYPWGPSLLISAYLYDTQSDYFVDPNQSGVSTTFSLPSILSSSSASGSTPFAIPRRRGVYNFLRWRIELYMARLIQGRSSITASAASLHSAQSESATHLPAEHDFSQGRSQSHGGNSTETDVMSEFDRNNRGVKHSSHSIQLQNTLLGGNEIDFLVNREVLANPLVEVQQDTHQNRLDVLECRDLIQDVQIWRGWLSKA
ncbi:unnamed protein product [Phytomonas sp. Hart1]|nr:unnamed protein product [Phytomonas sp. Hart1]|eukprot:CCW72141.1 unnamed protein product [Phytomonas sp. isolate Hart1]